MAKAEYMVRKKTLHLPRKKATQFLSKLEEKYKDNRFKVATWAKTKVFDDNEVSYFFVKNHLYIKSTWYKSDELGNDPKKVYLVIEIRYYNEEESIKEQLDIKRQVSKILKPFLV